MTITSSSKKTFKNLLKSLLLKNISTCIYLFLAVFFFFTLQYMIYSFSAEKITGALIGRANIYTTSSLFIVAAIWLAGVFAISLSQISYMHSRRAVDLFHSLPLTRSALMTANALTAFFTITIPMAANYLIVLLWGAIKHFQFKFSGLGKAVANLNYSPLEIVLDFLGWSASALMIIAVIMLIATQVGSIFDNLIFSAEILLTVPVLSLINNGLFELYLYGYGKVYDFTSSALFSPPLMMVGRYISNGDAIFPWYNWIIPIYLLCAVLILFFAAKLYGMRHSEMAESSNISPFPSFIFKSIAIYVGSALIGLLFDNIFDFSGDNFGFIIGVFVGALLVWALLEAILVRGFRGILKSFKLGAALTVVMTVLAVMLVNGGLGYEKRIPSVDKVEDITINYRSTLIPNIKPQPDTVTAPCPMLFSPLPKPFLL